MRRILEKYHPWLLPAVLILFVLQIVSLPFVARYTYAGRSEEPNHVLTYTPGKLAWDSATGINTQGVAELDLFDAEYANVKSEDGRNVVAPGLEGDNIVRLKNNGGGAVQYTAVLYRIRTNEDLPVEASVSAEGAAATASYSLPTGITQEHVLQAVTGSVGKDQIQDFDINWLWTYYEGDRQDEIDTMLGSRDEADRVTIGLYIVVEDNNSYVTPDNPKTGDDSMIGMYTTLMVISALLLILLIVDRRRQEEAECQEMECGE